MIVEFTKSTQNVCKYLGLAVISIILFMITPLNNFMVGKIVILLLLGYTLYYNTDQTNKFVKKVNLNIWNGNWNSLKTNVSCNYVFSLFLLVLIFSVIRKL